MSSASAPQELSRNRNAPSASEEQSLSPHTLLRCLERLQTKHQPASWKPKTSEGSQNAQGAFILQADVSRG